MIMSEPTVEELQNLEFIEEQVKNHIYKRCPNCQEAFDKNEACNHVTCESCKTPFCWVCEKKKGPGENECPYGHPTHNSH